MQRITRRQAIYIFMASALFPSTLAACMRRGTATPVPTARVPQPTPSPVASWIEEPVDGYLAVAPRTLQSGQKETVSVSLFKGQKPANGTVQVALFKDGQELATVAGQVRGRGDVTLAVPTAPEGDYTLQLTGKSFKASSTLRVEDGTLVFLESDKPIYKPGQTVHLRLLTLDGQLRPLAAGTTIEIQDAKGIKVFKKELQTDEFGMGAVDLPLSTEPNLGVWKATALAGKRTAQLDLRVETYVLPKYEITIDLAKDWLLASEQIKGTVAAEYSYGKPVNGEVQIKATRYVGTWQEFANVTRILDGQVDFSLPAPGYVAGVPGAGGMGNVQLDVTVREKSTGYEEKTSRLLSVAAAPIVLKVVPDSVTFKPGLPLNLLVVAQTPDKKPASTTVALQCVWTKSDKNTARDNRQIAVKDGKGLVKVEPPADAISLSLSATSSASYTSLAMQAGYSPSGAFIHLEQSGDATLAIGSTARFHITATKQAANFYYEVLARNKVVFSDVSPQPDIEFTVTPAMAPGARLLVYQILPTSEVAADYLPFSVQGDYPHKVRAAFSKEEVKPGEAVDVSLVTEGPARVGLAVVDRSVFILAENRLNLQQVFAELEALYQQPQVELHEAQQLPTINTWGASEVFRDAGVVVLSNQNVPAGKQYEAPHMMVLEGRGGGPVAQDAAKAAVPAAAPTAVPAPAPGLTGSNGLAEVQRVRQFFPETWLWLDLTTDAAGKASKRVEAPDSITTWMLRAVALSKDKGLGVAEAELRVLQPFFVSADLPYACIRGEEFPVRVALYNYTDNAQDFTVELEKADWFDLTGAASKTVRVGANDLAGAEFTIRPQSLGTRQVKVTARSQALADAINKDLIVEPEGVAREVVDNLILAAGAAKDIDTAVPDNAISGSARMFLGLTGSYLTQAIDGLEGLLRMPFGCGEQNMILFAPNVFVARYLRETNQMKPEVMAKAESLMITGYQRELTYRRNDASFSAFGNQDQSGSLWLTAFVLKTFAQARGLIYIDDTVLSTAKDWIVRQQKSDGSFEPVGFLHHQDMLGGLQGKTALTAYLAIALQEAGEKDAAARAVRYVEGALPQSEDAYTLAIGAYALGLAKSGNAAAAADRLLQKAHESDGGLYWGDVLPVEGQPTPQAQGKMVAPVRTGNQSAAVETTGYALLALLARGDRMNAGRAARWLVGQRNAYGGYGSTQDTVVGLQALTAFAAGNKADVDATVTVRTGSTSKQLRVNAENVDVLQTIDLPVGGKVSVEAAGKGQVVLQAVRRYNVPDAELKQISAFQVDVKYGADQVAVNDLLDVDVSVRFTPPEPLKAGMVVVDVAVPTGFSPETASIDALMKATPKMKRYDLAGRKVIFYIEDMMPDEQIRFSFQARALYPVRAQAVTSTAYAYYRPELKGESLGGAVVAR